MSIISITPYYVGQVNQGITRWKLICTDTLAQVTAAGFLNSENLMGYTISPLDIIDCQYLYTGSISQPGTGTYVELIPAITFSQGISVITLSPVVNTGDVLLPVVSGHFANFNGTTGQIKDAGYLPSNAALTRVVMESGASVIGNIPKYNDVTGTLVDSGIAAVNYQPLTVTVTMTAAQVNGAYAAPFQLLAAVAGTAYIVLSAQIYTNVSTAFTAGGVAIVQYGNTVHGAGADALAATIPAAEITAAASQIYNLNGLASATVSTGITNTGLFFSNATQAFATGTGSSVTITLQVATLIATV